MSKNPTNEQTKRSYSTRFSEYLTEINKVPVRGKRRGFLPFDTNPFDRVFVSVILTVAVHLLWMRFLEVHITLAVATILMLLVSAAIIARG